MNRTFCPAHSVVGQSSHHALATLNEVIAGGKIGWVLEADLKNFSIMIGYFGSWRIESVIHA
jgi:RNA-directed DNA polymerase